MVCLLSVLMIGVFGNGNSEGEYSGEREDYCVELVWERLLQG